jgi:hypothetical protein
VVRGAVEENAWVPQIAAKAYGGQISVEHFDREATKELAVDGVCASEERVFDRSKLCKAAALVVAAVDVNAYARLASRCCGFEVDVKGAGAAASLVEERELLVVVETLCANGARVEARVCDDGVVQNVALLAPVVLIGDRVTTARQAVCVDSAGHHVALA